MAVYRKALLASYKVLYKVVNYKKNYTLLLACKDIVEIMFDGHFALQFTNIHLSNDIICRRVDIWQQLEFEVEELCGFKPNPLK